MNQFDHKLSASLLGTGIYSVSEASRLTGVSSSRIRRWLSGHHAGGKHYDRLWKSQIQIGEETFLGFRDLTEARVAAAFISAGLPAQKIRRAIEIAREKYGIDRPLSTNSFRTDGKTVFLVLAAETGEGVVDVLGDQFVFKKIIEPSFKGLVFDNNGIPVRWNIAPYIVIDPNYSFGQPMDAETMVPTQVLARAAIAEGSEEAAAKAYDVPLRSVRRSVAFEQRLAA